MKTLVVLFLSVSWLFSYDLDIRNELQKCSEIKAYKSRLMCFDVLALNTAPQDDFYEKGKIITRECSHCHGGRWEVSTNGDRLVSDMSEEEIYQSLLDYKSRKIESTLMNFQMDKHSKEDLRLMSKFIRYQIKSGKY